jgi:hypothetical protein
VAVLIMATVTSAMAQGQGGGRRGGRGGGGFGVNPLTVLSNEKVQSDLVLSADQKTQVTKLVEEAMAQGGGRRGAGGAGGAGGGAAAFQAARDEQMKKINEVLLQPQQDRFAQILLQLQGTATALADAKVADKLGLTSDQKSKLETLQTDYQQKIRDAIMNGAGGGGGGGFGNNPEVTKLRNEQNDKAKELLTADQQKQFDSMVGKKIDVDPATLRGGGRGRRGGQAAQPNA